MKTDEVSVLDAALDVFLRYGFKRTTMGDIAQAAGLSRQSLYARYANKDAVYAAGLMLYADRLLEQLGRAWAQTDDLGTRMDLLFDISVAPSFQMLRANPDASDMIDGAETPEGRAAMAKVTERKRAVIEAALTPHANALAKHSLTPAQMADFVETSVHTLLKTANDQPHLQTLYAALKASVLAVARG